MLSNMLNDLAEAMKALDGKKYTGLVGQTRPDLAAGTSLLHVRPTDHQQLGQPQPPAQRSQGQRRLGPDFFERSTSRMPRSWSTLTAAGQNADQLKSQAGFMVFIAGGNIDSYEGDAVTLLDWRSHRIKRQCRSTLAAETMAMDSAVDAGNLLPRAFCRSFDPGLCAHYVREIANKLHGRAGGDRTAAASMTCW